MSKFVWDITPQDLLEHSIWQFLFWKDDSVEESVVVPAGQSDAQDPNSALLIKCKFTDSKGNEFCGHIKYGLTGIENSQPCMFLDDEAINFWFGVSKPSDSELLKLSFPIHVTTEPEFGLPPQTETIEGFGYFDLKSGSKVVLR